MYKISSNVDKSSYLILRGRLLKEGVSFSTWLQKQIDKEINTDYAIKVIKSGVVDVSQITVRKPKPVDVGIVPEQFEESTVNTGRCQIPNVMCRQYGKLYLVALPTEEGFKKKELYLCSFHLTKAKAECDSVEEV